MALANTGSPKISPHLDNGLLVVTIVEFFSYLLTISLNNRFDDSCLKIIEKMNLYL